MMGDQKLVISVTINNDFRFFTFTSSTFSSCASRIVSSFLPLPPTPLTASSTTGVVSMSVVASTHLLISSFFLFTVVFTPHTLPPPRPGQLMQFLRPHLFYVPLTINLPFIYFLYFFKTLHVLQAPLPSYIGSHLPFFRLHFCS
ncbi:hypothetical protein BDZ97DRAFT_204199 [Flammula alnicola]|nr:hypothetical protein BDZ97DRAFT_204199 [Flammula alnicola]